MLDTKQQHAIRSAMAEACQVLRGVTNVEDSRDFVLALLFLKFLSDRAELTLTDGSSRPRQFVVPLDANFRGLRLARHEPGNGARIDQALGALEKANRDLQGLFQGIRFDSLVLGNAQQKDRLLSQLLGVFASSVALDFRNAGEADEVAAYACDSLIRITAASAGRRGVDFFTPPEISQLIARLVRPQAGEGVADPCCGSGSLLMECSRFARENSGGAGCALYGQEINGRTWALARMSMILHGETAQIEFGDSLRQPRLLAPGGGLRKFEVVVSSPPISVPGWGHEEAERDPYGRYTRGVPPRGSADYAFLSHMAAMLHPAKGRMAAVVSLGVLFRGAAEHQIRRRLIEENLIDAVVTLPPKLFSYTTIPVALLLLRTNKTDDRVLFVDASNSYLPGKIQNVLQPEDLADIESAYRTRKDHGRYARLVGPEEIAASDYNLTVARYISAVEEVVEVDLVALRQERALLSAELACLESKLATLLGEVPHA